MINNKIKERGLFVMAEHKNKIGYKDIFKQTKYMKTIFAAVINKFGDSIDSIAFVWLVYQVTQSAAWSAIIFGVNRIPTIFLQPFAGAVIEKKNKKYIMIVTDIIRGICVGFVATALIMGFLNQWILLASTVVISCAEAFRMPASTALIPKLLDEKYYEFGLSLNTSVCGAAELIGLGAAGVIISVFSVSAAIYIDMITFFISALIILTLKIKERNYNNDKINVNYHINNLKSGFFYMKTKPALIYFAILGVFLNGVIVPFNSLQAPLINEVLNESEIMLSVIGIALTMGITAGASIYPYVSRKLQGHTFVGLGGYSFGIYYFTFVLAGKYIDSKIILYIIISVVSFLTGIAISLSNSYVNIEFIKNIKEDYLARVSAILGAVCTAAIPIVSIIVSILVKNISIEVLFIISGVLSIIIGIFLCNKKRFIIMTEDKIENKMEALANVK
jgi:MFS family permease